MTDLDDVVDFDALLIELRNGDVICRSDFIPPDFVHSRNVVNLNKYLNKRCNSEYVITRKCLEIAPNHTIEMHVETYPSCDSFVTIIPLADQVYMILNRNQTIGDGDTQLKLHDVYRCPVVIDKFSIRNSSPTRVKVVISIDCIKRTSRELVPPNMSVSSLHHVLTKRSRVPFPILFHTNLFSTESSAYLHRNVRLCYRDIMQNQEVKAILNYAPVHKCLHHAVNDVTCFMCCIYDDGQWLVSTYVSHILQCRSHSLVCAYMYVYVLEGQGFLIKQENHVKTTCKELRCNDEFFIRVTASENNDNVTIESSTCIWLLVCIYEVPKSFNIVL